MNRSITNGWINIDKLYELIKKEYLNNYGKYKNIGEFLPRVIEYLSELKGSPIETNATVYGLSVDANTNFYVFSPTKDSWTKLVSQISTGNI